MRYSTAVLGAAALYAAEVAAFPFAAFEAASMSERDIDAKVAEFMAAREKRSVGFNAEEQYVSTSGQYAFVAPDLSTDNRGPCPGLNAMANHGYLPHNGVATIPEFIKGTYDVFGMGRDLGAFLAVYGALIDGDGTRWSIGGPTPELPGLLGLLGVPQGISGSHNKYEADASPTRPDLYEYGNDYKFVMSQWEDMYSQPLGPNGYDLTTLTPFRAKRFQQSIDQNPAFFNAPFSGVIVQPAAYTFIYRFMANKSAEYPEGYLDGETLKSFFSVTGEPGNFVWTEGNERIPDNWYKRAIDDPYTIPFFALDAVAAALEYPQFANVGGNTGKVDTFTGLNLEDLTGGIFNLATLLEGNNLACFGFQAVQNLAPDLIKGLFVDPTGPLGTLTAAVDNATAPFTCPQLAKFDKSQFAPYPGAQKAAPV